MGKRVTIKSNPFTDEQLKTTFKDDFITTDTWRIFRIMSEFVEGFEGLSQIKQGVSIFGSKATPTTHKYYKLASKTAYNLTKKGYTVITGAGGGIMEAANKGAYETKGESVGLNISLPEEEGVNKYVKDSANFSHFFVRKVMLSFASQVYIFFPGGFGTLDEFFELVTLVQTKKVSPIPIVLVDKDYWQPILDMIKTNLYEKHKTISQADMDLYHLVPDAKSAHALIKKLVTIKK